MFMQKERKVIWRSPSNIAIIKYWGKHGVQLPRNASFSFTLSEAYTDTEIVFKAKTGSDDPTVEQFLFEGEENLKFAEKVIKYIESISSRVPFLDEYSLSISSSNSFPHSSGIASSASSMSALAMGLCDIERILAGREDLDYFKASELARLGSGSASRSVFPIGSVWGLHPKIERSSDIHAIKYDQIHPVFKNYRDDIIIVSEKEKAVSSRAGHALMENNPYADDRFAQANQRLTSLVSILETGDVDAFCKMAEDEALALHGMMMCSNPSYMLMEPATVSIIKAIRSYRKKTRLPICFTLDAGPNVHVLYPETISSEIALFIEDELLPLSNGGKVLKDKVGNGPTKIK